MLNYYTILLTNKRKQLEQRKEYVEVHKMYLLENLSFENISDFINNEIKPNQYIVSILSFVDGYVTLASKLRDVFTANPSNTKAIETMESKILTRNLFKDYYFNTTYSRVIINEENRYLFDYPLIIKKSSSSSSRYVKKVNDAESIPDCYINSNDVLIEEFVTGDQYLYEVFVLKGVPYVVAKFKQDIYTIDNSFIILGYSLDKNFKISEKEKKILNHITKELNVMNGEFHLEIREDRGIYKLIEVNPRPTGEGMNEILKVATGVDYIEQVVKFYLGDDFKIPRVKNNTYTQFLISEENGILTSVTGRKRAYKVPGVSKVFIKRRKDNYISKPRHMGDRHGYVITTGENMEIAKENAIKASKLIKFNIEEEE